MITRETVINANNVLCLVPVTVYSFKYDNTVTTFKMPSNIVLKGADMCYWAVSSVLMRAAIKHACYKKVSKSGTYIKIKSKHICKSKQWNTREKKNNNDNTKLLTMLRN